MARPTKLTAALLEKLEQIADDQWSIKDAARSLNIDEDTWRRWEAKTADDDESLLRFHVLAKRVREGSGRKIEELAWGALRQVLESDPDARPSDRVAAAAAILRLRTAHRVEVSGPEGGPVRVDVDDARARLMAGIERSGES